MSRGPSPEACLIFFGGRPPRFGAFAAGGVVCLVSYNNATGRTVHTVQLSEVLWHVIRRLVVLRPVARICRAAYKLFSQQAGVNVGFLQKNATRTFDGEVFFRKQLQRVARVCFRRRLRVLLQPANARTILLPPRFTCYFSRFP